MFIIKGGHPQLLQSKGAGLNAQLDGPKKLDLAFKLNWFYNTEELNLVLLNNAVKYKDMLQNIQQ